MLLSDLFLQARLSKHTFVIYLKVLSLYWLGEIRENQSIHTLFPFANSISKKMSKSLNVCEHVGKLGKYFAERICVIGWKNRNMEDTRQCKAQQQPAPVRENLSNVWWNIRG
jgi:hypothetical protein